MNLKKSDKIIAIVGVLILVIAAIGIVFFYSPEGEEEIPTEPEKKLYYVEVIDKSGSLSTISDLAGKNSPYEDTTSIGQENLKSITFNLSWVDDKATFFKTQGLDTLTLEVTAPDGTVYEDSAKSAKTTKEGNVVITIDVNNVPYTEPIEAEDRYDAEEQLEQSPYYSDKRVNEEFKIKVSVDVGEIRILKKLFETGNIFDLEITYDYYDYELSEVEDNEDEGYLSTGLESDQETRNSAFWNNIMSCGRSWI